jgi:predicted phage tail protein
VAPATVPGAPTLTDATRGNGQVTLTWTAPASNGGSPVTGYTVNGFPSGTCSTSGALSCTATGLTNGTTYSFTVAAANAVGRGAASNSLSATPATVPGAPTLAGANAGSNSVALTWIAPLSNGGSAVTGYTATAFPGGATCTSTGTGCTVAGLTNGTTYSFTVTATNSVGSGPASNAVFATPTAPATVPGAPTLTDAARGDARVTLAWTAPASDGGSPITGYTATASPGGATCTTNGALGCTVTGLTNGSAYTFTVTATNAAGTGAASNPLSASPAAVPGAPTLTTAVRADGSVTLAWAAPASNGGSPVTGYTVTASPGGATCATDGALACTVTGLTNGTPYSFTVTATNAVGAGPASNPLTATPATVPGAPTLTAADAGDAKVDLTWTAPTADGGATITGYTVTAAPGGATCTTNGAPGCTVTGLTNGTTYTFTVTATNAVGTGSPSNSLTARPATVPGAPTLTDAAPGPNSVALAWQAPASNGGSPVTGYTVTASPGAATCTTTGSLGCTVVGLTAGTSYSFTVTATNALGTGPASNALFALPFAPATKPAAPTLMSAVPGNSVTLTWAAPVSDGGSPVTGYNVYRGTWSGGESLLASVGDVTTWTDTTTTYGTTYYYTVSAVNAVGESDSSAELQATPLAPSDTTAPSKPASLKAIVTGTTQTILDWPASTDNVGVTGYRVYRDGAPVATVGDNQFLDSGLPPGSSHSYYVRAVDAAGNQSLASSSTSVRVGSQGTGSNGTLSGAVFNAAGKALSNAVVRTTLPTGAVKSSKTNKSGVFNLSSLPAGSYTITASLSGYPTYSGSVSVVGGRTVLVLVTLA